MKKESFMQEVNALQEKFNSSMEDDLNTADAIAAIFEIVKLANTNCKSDSSKEFILAVKDKIVMLCDILGIIAELKKNY